MQYYPVMLCYTVKTLTRVHTEGKSWNNVPGFYSQVFVNHLSIKACHLCTRAMLMFAVLF